MNDCLPSCLLLSFYRFIPGAEKPFGRHPLAPVSSELHSTLMAPLVELSRDKLKRVEENSR